MRLRLLTANLYNGRARPDSLIDVLETVRPDVVAVQELSSNCADVLWDWGDSRLLDPDDETMGMGMAVRTDATFERLRFPCRDPIRARFDGAPWGHAEIEVVTAHLVNPVSRPWSESRRQRAAELSALESIMTQPGGVRILLGDLNSSPIWPLYKRLRTIASDAAVSAGNARATWSYFPWSPPLLRIDHAFVQGAKALRTSTVKIRGTDHRGLVVDLAPADN